MDTMHGLAIAFGNKGGVGLTTDALWWYWVGLIYRSRLLALKEATRPPHWNHSSSLGLIVFTCGRTTELNQSKLHFIEASSNVRSRPKRWHLNQQNPGISSEAQKKMSIMLPSLTMNHHLMWGCIAEEWIKPNFHWQKQSVLSGSNTGSIIVNTNTALTYWTEKLIRTHTFAPLIQTVLINCG